MWKVFPVGFSVIKFSFQVDTVSTVDNEDDDVDEDDGVIAGGVA